MISDKGVLDKFGFKTSPRARAILYLGLVVLSVIALWISAKVSVPFYPVPMTLQTLVIMVLAASSGARIGVAAVSSYLVMGAIGLPVFAGTPQSGIGLVYMAGPTGGYLAGFILLALFSSYGGKWAQGRSKLVAFVGLAGGFLLGTMAVYLLGATWLSSFVGIEKAWDFGVVPFLLGDLLKVLIASSVMLASSPREE